MEVWITRGKGKGIEDCYVDIWPYGVKPERNEDIDGTITFGVGTDKHIDDVWSMTVPYFKEVFGFTPKKGRRKAYLLKIMCFPAP